MACQGRSSYLTVKMIGHTIDDMTFRALLARLRCQGCRGKLAPVYLLADQHRQCSGGGAPGWLSIWCRLARRFGKHVRPVCLSTAA